MMEETVSPMVEMMSTGPSGSIDNDEYIQDFRMSLSNTTAAVDTKKKKGPHSPFVRIMKDVDPVKCMDIYTPVEGGDSLLITGSESGYATVWNVRTCKMVRKLEGVHTHRLRSLALYVPESIPGGAKDFSTGPAGKGETVLSRRVLVVTCSDDKTAAVWDLMNGTLIKHLKGGHRWFIISCAIYMPTYGTAPFVVTSGWDNYSIVWNLGTGKQIMRLAASNPTAVSAVVDFVCPQLQIELGRDPLEVTRAAYLLTAGFDKSLTIWDSESGAMVKEFPAKHTDIISCAAVFVPPADERGLYCISGSFDHTAIVWDLLTGAVIRVLAGHTDWITSVAMFRANSGKPFFAMGLTGCHDGTATLWDLVHGFPIRKFEGIHKLQISGVKFLPRYPSQGVSSRSAYDPNVRSTDYYQVTSRRVAAERNDVSDTSKLGTPLPLGEAGSSTEGQQDEEVGLFPYIVTCSEDQTVAVWDLDSEQRQHLLRDSLPLITSAAAVAAGAELPRAATAGNKSRVVSLNEQITRDWVVSLQIFAPEDGRRPVLLSGSSTGTASAWDLLSGEVIRVFAGVHASDVGGVDFVESSFGKFLSVSNQGVRAAKALPVENTSSETLRPCTSTPTAALLVVTGGFDAMAAVWDFDSGEVVQLLQDGHTDSISHLAASGPVGDIPYSFVVTGSYDNTGAIWNLHTGTIVHRLAGAHRDGITHVAIYKPAAGCGAETRVLALTASVDATVVLWDVLTGSAVRTLAGAHVERIKTVITYQPRYGGPVAITGGYDKRTVVWDLHTGAVKRTLAGVHRNWVTCVAVVEPIDGGPAFVVSGGFDSVPVIWDFESGAFLSKLEGGHSNGLRAIVAYAGVPGDHGRYAPLILSAGHEASIVKWDCLYPFTAMPPHTVVQGLFELDKSDAQDKSWPRISALSARYGEPLWAENALMFIRACKLRRSDFLGRFQSMLMMMLARMGDVVPGKSLLRYALEGKDLQSVRVILRCWSRILCTPICSTMMIRVHSSMLLPLQEVLLLGEVYPAEFTEFMTSLRLISVDLGVSMSAIIDTPAKSLTAGCTLDTVEAPYKLFDVAPYGQESRGQPVSLAYVPLQGAASVEMLHMFMQTSLALGSVEVFDSDIAIYALRFAWRHYGLRVHAMGIVIFCIFFIIYTPNILLFEKLTESGNASYHGLAWFLQSVTFTMILVRTYYSFTKFVYYRARKQLDLYFGDGWNFLDVVSIVFALIGLFARFAAAGETTTSRSVLAVTTVLLWMRGLYYLRPFRVSGPLVSMVIAIAYDIKVFLLIMVVALIGFAQGFWLLSRRDEGLPFGTPSQALLSSFNYMMGNFDLQFEGSISPTLSTFLVVLFVVFMIILMLNLLIALMGNTFAYVSGKGLAQWRQEQTSIILDEQFLRDDKMVVPPCLYVLMYTSDFEEYCEQRDVVDAAGKAGAVVAQAADGLHEGHKTPHHAHHDLKIVNDGLAALEEKVMERVGRLEQKLESLLYKMDAIANKMK